MSSSAPKGANESSSEDFLAIDPCHNQVRDETPCPVSCKKSPQQLENIDPDKAKELLRIEQVYTYFGLDDSTINLNSDGDSATCRLLHYLPRIARMKGFRLYWTELENKLMCTALVRTLLCWMPVILPTPSNNLAVLNPLRIATDIRTVEDKNPRQYYLEVWQHLQRYHGYGCALLHDSQFTLMQSTLMQSES